MSKHTPGPWEIEWPDYDQQKECYDDEEAGEYDGSAYLTAPGGKGWKHFASVAVICNGDPDETGAANARLIAAAPDLLECLKDMVAGFEDTLERYGHVCGDVAKARAAIAKAEPQ